MIDAESWNEEYKRGGDGLHKRYPFLPYAINYWAPHLHGDGEIELAGLSIAAFFGLTRNLEAEIEKGLLVNDIDSDYHTALYYAAAGGHESTVLFLVQAGADAQAGMSAIGPAIKCGNLHVARLLIDSGGDLNITNINEGVPALHTACEEGNECVVRFMLDNAAEVDSIPYGSNCTPLWYAVQGNCPNIVSMLLEVALTSISTTQPSHQR